MSLVWWHRKVYNREYWVYARKEMGFDGMHHKTRWWLANYSKWRGHSYYYSLRRERSARVRCKNKHGYLKHTCGYFRSKKL